MLDFIDHPNDKRFHDLTGQQFQKLTVLGYAGKMGKRQDTSWWCQCECGKVHRIRSRLLITDIIKKCSCAKQTKRTRHHMHDSSEYRTYYSAKNRCNNPLHPRYKDYGGRGIKFKFKSFKEFLKVLGLKPGPEYSIDRIDNDGHYEKGNVEWVTIDIQSRKKRTTKSITFKGKTLCAFDWGQELGIPTKLIYERLARNWCGECALTVENGQGSCPHRTKKVRKQRIKVVKKKKSTKGIQHLFPLIEKDLIPYIETNLVDL